MAWEVLIKKNRYGGRTGPDLIMTKQKRSRLGFSLSPSLLRKLGVGSKDKLRVMFDKDDGLVGLRVTDASDPNGFAVSCVGKGRPPKARGYVRVSIDEKLADKCVNGCAREFRIDDLLIQDGLVCIEMLK